MTAKLFMKTELTVYDSKTMYENVLFMAVKLFMET